MLRTAPMRGFLNFMEEIQQEIQNPRGKHVSLPLLFFTGVIFIYFLIPVIFDYPLYLLYRRTRGPVVHEFERRLFYPVNTLRVACPAYENLIQWELHQAYPHGEG
jgi:hypothetical protein